MGKTNIALMGLMGCGKSTVGIALSKSTGMAFLDTDSIVEEMAGCAISEIFAEKGEEHFRALEEKAVKEAARMSWTIIATGGGAVKRKANVKALRRTSIVFYLRAPVETLYERTLDSGRPLIEVPDPKGRLNELLIERDPLYRAACDKIISCEGKAPEQLAAQIIGMFRLLPY
jgi:shikimate kinase